MLKHSETIQLRPAYNPVDDGTRIETTFYVHVPSPETHYPQLHESSVHIDVGGYSGMRCTIMIDPRSAREFGQVLVSCADIADGLAEPPAPKKEEVPEPVATVLEDQAGESPA